MHVGHIREPHLDETPGLPHAAVAAEADHEDLLVTPQPRPVLFDEPRRDVHGASRTPCVRELTWRPHVDQGGSTSGPRVRLTHVDRRHCDGRASPRPASEEPHHERRSDGGAVALRLLHECVVEHLERPAGQDRLQGAVDPAHLRALVERVVSL